MLRMLLPDPYPAWIAVHASGRVLNVIHGQNGVTKGGEKNEYDNRTAFETCYQWPYRKKRGRYCLPERTDRGIRIRSADRSCAAEYPRIHYGIRDLRESVKSGGVGVPLSVHPTEKSSWDCDEICKKEL